MVFVRIPTRGTVQELKGIITEKYYNENPSQQKSIQEALLRLYIVNIPVSEEDQPIKDVEEIVRNAIATTSPNKARNALSILRLCKPGPYIHLVAEIERQ